MARRLVENRRDFETARKIRETFVDRPMKRVLELDWTWPRSMDAIGVCTAVMYTSDKWKKIGDYEDYKHIAETAEEKHQLLISGPRDFEPGFGPTVEIFCDPHRLDRMPDAIAVMAKILGLQCRLYDKDGRLGEDYYQMNIPGAMLGGAKHPNGETILLVYTKRKLCCLITGFEIEKDGIVK